MRNLIIHRERALAAFALTYYVHVNKNREEHMQELAAMSDPRLEARGDYGLRNGQTIRIPLDESENRFFIGIYTQEKNHISSEVPVEPGTQDVYFKIITDFDGNKRISFQVQPMEGPET